MKKLLLAIAFFLAPIASAYAQVPVAIAQTACGGQSLTAGRYFPLALDLTGNLCTSGSGGGGGGGAITAADGAIVTMGHEADAAWSGSGSATQIALLKALASGPYPSGAVALTSSPSNGTTAAIVATLTPVTGHTAYICGFSARANATGATTVNLVVSGTISGSMNFLQWIAPLASGIGLTEETFSPCVPASAVTTNIVVTTGAPGSGGAGSVSAWGYSL